MPVRKKPIKKQKKQTKLTKNTVQHTKNLEVIDHRKGQFLGPKLTKYVKSDPYTISVSEKTSNYTSGLLVIKPGKKKSNSVHHDNGFVIYTCIFGKGAVIINKTIKEIIEEGQGFKVPPGNSYEIINHDKNLSFNFMYQSYNKKYSMELLTAI